MARLSITNNSLCSCNGGCKNSRASKAVDSDSESDELLPATNYLRSTSGSSIDLSEGEEAIRRKLKWYFMNPYQKFKDKGRKPWKLLLQIIKIILVTVQYYNISNAIGSFTPGREHNKIKPINLCVKKIQRSYYMNGIDPSNDEDFTYNCSTLLPPESGITGVSDFLARNHIPSDFTWIQILYFNFILKSINLKEFQPEDIPDCYTFNVSVLFDNNDQDAVFQLYLKCESIFSHCKKGDVDDASEVRNLKAFILLLDLVVIISCSVSFVLCSRSLFGHLRLCRETRKFFKEYRHDKFVLADTMNFINLWICLTLLNDVCTIVGSVMKITIDQSGMSLYDMCSIFLGVSTIFSWIGVLRYLGYSKNYNALLVTLKVAFPTVIRFILCAAFIYIGFMFCGWIVFGPYHKKFESLSVTSECLFSLINGDDMFATFSGMDDSNLAIFIFSKVYLYIFISLFIFCVNSLFIGIISDTYERIKDYGHPPKTRVELFMEGREYDTPYITRSMDDAPIPDGHLPDDIYEGDPTFMPQRERRHNHRCYRTFTA